MTGLLQDLCSVKRAIGISRVRALSVDLILAFRSEVCTGIRARGIKLVIVSSVQIQVRYKKDKIYEVQI